MPLTSRTIRCVQQIQPEYINVACSRHWHRLLGHLFSNVLINHFNSITSKIVVIVVVSMMFSSFFRVYTYVCHKKITHQHTASHSYRYIRSLSVRRFVGRFVPRILPSLVCTHRSSKQARVRGRESWEKDTDEIKTKMSFGWIIVGRLFVIATVPH